MEGLQIGEVAQRAGLRASAIRYYESEGLLPNAARRSGRRVYDPSVLQRLALIALAQEAGFSISEIRTLLHGFSRRTPPSVRWRSLAERKREELEATIKRTRAMKRVLENLLHCECPTLEDCGRALRERTGS